MAGPIRLFEKVDGLLVEVPLAEVDKRREGRRHRSMSIVADVLLTAEEEAARDAEEAAETARRQASAEAAAVASERRAAALAKLEALGLTIGDIKNALA